MPFMLLCVTVLPFTTRVERSASNTPAPVLVSTVALRSTAAEAKPMKIPAGGPKTVWPAVELPLIVLAKGSPNPASPIMAVDSVRKMPQPEFPLIVFPPIRSARDWKRRTPKRTSGLLGLVPLPVTVFPKMSASEFCVTWMPFAPLPLMMFAPGTEAFENPIRPVLAPKTNTPLRPFFSSLLLVIVTIAASRKMPSARFPLEVHESTLPLAHLREEDPNAVQNDARSPAAVGEGGAVAELGKAGARDDDGVAAATYHQPIQHEAIRSHRECVLGGVRTLDRRAGRAGLEGHAAPA